VLSPLSSCHTCPTACACAASAACARPRCCRPPTLPAAAQHPSRPAAPQTYFTFDLSGEALRVQRRIYGLTPEAPGDDEPGGIPQAEGPQSPGGASPMTSPQVRFFKGFLG
jgi:hypothetical protein